MKKALWLAGLVGWSMALQTASGQVRLGLPTDAETGTIQAVVAPPAVKTPTPAQTPADAPPTRFEIVIDQPPRALPARKTPAKQDSIEPEIILVGEGEKKLPPKQMPTKQMPREDKKEKPATEPKTDPAPLPPVLETPTIPAEPLPDTALTTVLSANGLPKMHVWLAPEYILWQTSGMHLPPLITQAPPGVRATLDNPLTTVVQGNQYILDEFRSGVLLRGGVWLNCDATVGVDASAFWLGQEGHRFTIGSNGNPSLFRPFFSAGGVANGVASAFSPNGIPGQLAPVIVGSVHVGATTDLSGGDANARVNFVQSQWGRLDGLVGYRYLRLRDTLSVREDLAFPNTPNTLITNDRFETTNEFSGAQIGLAGETRRGPWSLAVTGKLALGNTRRETFIDGDNIANAGTAAANRFPGGVLAQTSNMGTHINNDFAVVPEVGVTVGYYFSERLKVSAGWNMLYWSQVGRAGDQIDLNVGQIPPTTPGAVGPFFHNNNTDFWAQGFRAGLQWQY